MSNRPYLTLQDFQEIKNACRHHLDYLMDSGVRRDAPEVYEKARQTNLRVLDFVQLWEQYPGIGDQIEIGKPTREI